MCNNFPFTRRQNGKKAYVDAEGKCTCPKDLPYCVCGNVSLGKIITKNQFYQQKRNARKFKKQKRKIKSI